MGSSANERIALQIETSANLAGIREARAETVSLGAAARTATEQVTITAAQSDAAWKRANGSVSVYNTEITKIVAQENALAVAARRAADELLRQSRVPLQGPVGPQLGPATPGMTTGLAAAAAQAATATTAINKIPGSARTAANAFGLLSQAAVTGAGSMAGLATAAGSVAFGISALSTSAKVAASATGIGALITIAVLAAEVLAKLTATAKNTQVTIDHIGAFSTRQLSGASLELAAINAQLGAAQKKASDASHGDLPGLPSRGAMAANQELENLLEKRNALASKIRELEKADVNETRDRTLAGIAIVASAQQTSAGRYRAQLAVIESERAEAIRTRALTESAANTRAATERRALATQGADYIDGLSEANAAHVDALTTTSFQARINAAERAAAKEREDLKLRALKPEDETAALTQIELRRKGIVVLAERERDAALATSAARRASESLDPRAAQQGKLDLIEQEYRADVKLLGVVEALAIAEAKRLKLARDNVQQGLAGYSALSAAVKNHGTVVGAMAKAAADAVRLHEIYVQGKLAWVHAKMEFAAATAAYASGNVVGGTLHLAAAGGYLAAVAAAGVEAAGVVGGGGGGGGASGGSGAGESGTFQPRDGSGANGAQIINLYTVNPFSRETISVVSYELGRAGVLKRPIQVPPTTGILGAA